MIAVSRLYYSKTCLFKATNFRNAVYLFAKFHVFILVNDEFQLCVSKTIVIYK